MKKILSALLLWALCLPAYSADNTVSLTTGAGVTMRTVDVGSGIQSSMVILGSTAGVAIYGTAGTANANVLTIQGIASGTVVPVSLTGNVATTAADGSNVVLGTTTDAACATDNGTCTENALIKRTNQRLTTLITNLGSGNSNGQAITANSAPVTVAKNSGTGSTIAGAAIGSAGTAATEVVTIQGIASGTVVPVSLTSTTITGTVAATQSGTWNITNVSGTVSLPTGASTAANQTSVIGTKNAGTAATNSLLAGAVFNSTPLTVTDTQQASLQSDANGYLKVNVAAGGASGGTSSTFAAAFPATGTAIGMSQGGNMVALTGTSNNLNVQCANCSGSGVSTADEAAFTAGSSLFAGIGGFFQTTATSNALTNGQQGMLQMTAQRAGFVNLRAVGGTEIGTSSAEVFVGGRGTAGSAAGGVLTIQGVASMTKLLVTPDSVALPANQSVNVSQINAVTPLMGNGVTGTGSQRVTIASDNTAFTVNAAQSGTWNVTNVSGTVSLPTGASTSANQTTWQSATAAAPPANAVYLGANSSGATGGLLAGLIQCDSTAVYDASTNGSTELKALTSGRTIYVCGYTIFSGGTTSVKLIYGTGTACATGSTNMTPAYPLTAQVGIVDGSPFSRGLKTASANALCINTNAGVAVQAIVYYAVI